MQPLILRYSLLSVRLSLPLSGSYLSLPLTTRICLIFLALYLAWLRGACRLRMNSAHYDKMKELFRRAGAQRSVSLRSRGGSASLSNQGPLPVWIGDFHDSLFACLMRYEALQVSRVNAQSLISLCFYSGNRTP